MAKAAVYENVPAIENNFTVKVRPYFNRERLSPHWHEHIELLFFTQGKGDFLCDGKSFAVEKGDFVIVNSTEAHSYAAREPIDLICILIYPEFFSDINFSHIQLKNLIRGDRYIAGCIEEIYKEYTDGTLGSDMMIKSFTYKLMAYLLREYTVSQMSQREIATQNIRLARLNRIVEYISANYNQKITTKQLAEMSFLNENHFCRFFKKSVGKTVSEYLNEFRIEKAGVLLSATDKSIADIASEVGFDDINYFSRMFKKIRNMSPSEYRKSKK